MLLYMFRLIFYLFVVTTILLCCLIKYLNAVIKPKSKVCLVGKTAIVTGANRGIGLELALALAMRGCRVIIACRRNLEEAKQKIIDETKNPNIIGIHLDLLSLKSVRAFAKQVIETEDRLDILIHNAVILKAPNKCTEDGLHPLVQVSHFGPFLLTHLLADIMKKSGPGRIVFVSSFLAYMGNVTLEKLTPPQEKLTASSMNELYNNNKLCNIISAIGFSDKLKDHGITVNAVHPGMVKTTVFDVMTSPRSSLIYKLIYILIVVPFSKAHFIVSEILCILFGTLKLYHLKKPQGIETAVVTPEEGTYAILDVVTNDDYRHTTGEFIYDRGPICKPKIARNPKICDDIWQASENYVKLLPEERLLSA